MLKQKLQGELKQSVLARDQLKTSVLRLLLSAIGYYEIQKSGAGYEATEEDILTVIQKEAKQRKDSIEQFTKANRFDLADKESKELKILQGYLPQQLTEDQIRSAVLEAISESGATTLQDMGKIMKVLMPKIKGKADLGLVSKLVREKLS